MSTITAAIATKVLDGLYARQQATSSNVANANSVDFIPMRVSFESALKQASNFQAGDSVATVVQRIASVQPQVTLSSVDDGATVQLDKELTIASETSARYAMLIGMLSREMQMKELIVSGG